MNALLDWLRKQAMTLTVYNYEGTDEQLDALAGSLSASGVAVVSDTTGRETPANFGVFHRDGEVLDVVSVDDVVPEAFDFETLLDSEGESDAPDVPVPETEQLRVSPQTTRTEMVGISRTFERRALREESGTLLAGFQNFSVMADSERTMSVYERLADAGVDVTVYGYPDADLDSTPFETVADTDEQFRDYWFLLYDGGQNPQRKAALVSRQHDPDLYDSFWTVDPEMVDELFGLARGEYPALVEA